MGGIGESMSAPSSQKRKFLNIFKYVHILFYLGFSKYGKGLTWSVVKNLPASAGDLSSIPRSGRSSGEGNGKPLQYPCLGNPVDRGA